MFESLTERLSGVLSKLAGKANLTEDNIKDSLADVRRALLEADVALEVVTSFLGKVQTRVIGVKVPQGLSPGQFFIKSVKEELIELLGSQNEQIVFNHHGTTVILLAGLQGSGKTTSSAKLARFLQQQHKKKVMLVSVDIYRPAAIEQLAVVGAEVGAAVFPSSTNEKPKDIVKRALATAKKQQIDVLLVDTAGRMHIDELMMTEIKELHAELQPTETLFVVDSMTGQDAANTAKVFHDTLPLTGVILTKIDGDARGGAALSVKSLTGKPIKFLGVGEKLDALEAFHPDRIASRILGMGDVLSLIDEIEAKVDKKSAEKLQRKLSAGKKFDLEDYREQLLQMQNMGGMENLMKKMPGMGMIPKNVQTKVSDKKFTEHMAIICSMTMQERKHPAIIKGTRKQRIAKGSGTTLPAVNKLLKQHQQMAKMMKKFSGKGMAQMLNSLKGKLPTGFGNLG